MKESSTEPYWYMIEHQMWNSILSNFEKIFYIYRVVDNSNFCESIVSDSIFSGPPCRSPFLTPS